MKKYLRTIKKLADEFNRDVTILKRRSHLALKCRDGRRPTVFTSSTPGDFRVVRNLRSQLRNANEARDAR